MIRDWLRELGFLHRDRSQLAGLALLLVLATGSLLIGRAEIERQKNAIEQMQVLNERERLAAIQASPDYGGAAYASYYATWNAPSELAFAALGQRDISPYMLRVRALALEGQIYAADSLNPELGLSGRLDYAFVIAFLLPLLVIFLLHDFISSEREAGRYPLLTATAGATRRLWLTRVGVRTGALFLCALLPLLIIGAAEGVSLGLLLLASMVVAMQVAVWTLLAIVLARRDWSSTTIAAALVTVWLTVSLVVPLGGKLVIDRISPAAEGADIALTQREAVNDAWDLPKANTMQRFFAAHPEWSDTDPVTAPFHWKWYFAFQHVGDLTAAEASEAYRRSIAARDRLSGYVSSLSPAVAVQRALQRLASTDVQAALDYDRRIRNYHTAIRQFYYPFLFNDRSYDASALRLAPEFSAGDDG